MWTTQTKSGVRVDLGGAFIGPHHDRFHALAKEMGVSTFPTYAAGDSILSGWVDRSRLASATSARNAAA